MSVGIFVCVLAIAGILYKNLTEKYDGMNLQLQGTKEDGETAEGEEEQNNSYTEAYDFTVYDADGNKVRLSDFRGKPVVLNFWATWCYYCIQEMPEFEEAYKNYPDVQFLMVNATDGVQETVEKAKGFIESEKYGFDVFYDSDQSAVTAYRISGLPATFFIDAEGNLIARASGMLDAKTLEKGIQMITEEQE